MMNRILQALVSLCLVYTASSASVKIAMETEPNVEMSETEVEYIKTIVLPLVFDMAFDGDANRRRHLLKGNNLEERITEWLEEHENSQGRRLGGWADVCDGTFEFWYLILDCSYVPGGRALRERALTEEVGEQIATVASMDMLGHLQVTSICERVLSFISDSVEFESIITDPPFCHLL